MIVVYRVLSLVWSGFFNKAILSATNPFRLGTLTIFRASSATVTLTRSQLNVYVAKQPSLFKLQALPNNKKISIHTVEIGHLHDGILEALHKRIEISAKNRNAIEISSTPSIKHTIMRK